LNGGAPVGSGARVLILLSPAKTLNFDGDHPPLPLTRPRFENEAARLARSAARLSRARLATLMHVSPALADLNARRFRGFADAPERAALFAFDGDVYRGLDAATLSTDALARAGRRLRLLSGLYGLLCPSDAIRPHRLEMGTRWAPGAERLTDWWGDRVARAVADAADAAGTDTVLNLASNEYWAAVAGRLPPRLKVIVADFREGPDRRFVSFHAKRARGALARWVLERGATTADALTGFDGLGYGHDPGDGASDRLTFVRDAAA